MPPETPGAPGIPATGEPIVIPAPPSAGRQAMQLVLIPAAIVIVAITVAILFARLAGSTENIDIQLRRLKESSGEGRMQLNLQDPRYKNRSMAAYNVATMIPAIKDPAQRVKVSRQLVEILEKDLRADSDVDDRLHLYLLSALGQLGQPEGLAVIEKSLSSPGRSLVKQGGIRGLLSWPREEEVRATAGRLLPPLLLDEDMNVAALAAVALGQLGDPSDEKVRAALKEAAAASKGKRREVQWNSAVALARMGDAEGSRYVVDVLLSREALAQMEADGAGERPEVPAGTRLSRAEQDKVILSTLAASVTMPDGSVWEKIARLRAEDPSVPVRTAASLVLERRKQGGTGASSTKPAPLEAPSH